MNASEVTIRLTEREKEALRAWLRHKTAKEIALDLGITHHAVEKRLKMARTKLGAGSSLEAARMLAGAEGYGQTATAAPDLPAAAAPRPSWQPRTLVLGGFVMMTLTVLGLALTAAYPSAEPHEIEINGDLSKLFAHLDTDGSGFLERPESPFVAIAFVDDSSGAPQDGEAIIGDGTNPDHIAEFYAAADTDGDGRISFAEYTEWSKARWGEIGIEIRMIMKVLPSQES